MNVVMVNLLGVNCRWLAGDPVLKIIAQPSSDAGTAPMCGIHHARRQIRRHRRSDLRQVWLQLD
jgi:hypothetical protein